MFGIREAAHLLDRQILGGRRGRGGGFLRFVDQTFAGRFDFGLVDRPHHGQFDVFAVLGEVEHDHVRLVDAGGLGLPAERLHRRAIEGDDALDAGGGLEIERSLGAVELDGFGGRRNGNGRRVAVHRGERFDRPVRGRASRPWPPARRPSPTS